MMTNNWLRLVTYGYCDNCESRTEIDDGTLMCDECGELMCEYCYDDMQERELCNDCIATLNVK